MNDRQKVVVLAVLTTLILLALYWLASRLVPVLWTDGALVGAVPVIVALGVLAPVLRGVRR